ncbi:MAG: FecR domain-containing protein [Bacteroidota bacterium]
MDGISEKEIDQLSATYGASFSPDVEAGLRKLRRRLDTSVPSPEAKVKSLSRRSWWTAAASVLLLLAAGLYLLNPQGTTLINQGSSPLSAALPDGTRVILQEGATLHYADDFNETDRRIELAGQAYLQVHKDQTRPFLVRTEGTELRVTGTAFNLRIDGEELEVEVSEGSVELHQGVAPLRVEKNQCGLAKPGQPAILMPAPYLNRHAWRTGRLHFEDSPLSEVLETLRKNFRIEISGGEDCDFLVNGNYRNEDPLAILSAIAKLGGGEAKIDLDKPKHYQLVNLCAN